MQHRPLGHRKTAAGCSEVNEALDGLRTETELARNARISLGSTKRYRRIESH
jgi:hypothetical protein